jgi:hypothetical protein
VEIADAYRAVRCDFSSLAKRLMEWMAERRSFADERSAISAAPDRASDLSAKKSGMLPGTFDCATNQGGGSREM